MISINATLVIQIVQFLILVFIINRLMFQPILRLIEERAGYFKDTKIKIGNIKDETEQLVKKSITIEHDMRKDASKENSLFKQEALKIAEKIFDDAKNEVALVRERVSKEIDDNLEVARKSLKNETLILADAITEKLIGRRIGN